MNDIDFLCEALHIDEILNRMTKDERLMLTIIAFQNFSRPKQKDGEKSADTSNKEEVV